LPFGFAIRGAAFAAGGAGLIALGTACSRDAWIAAAAMAVVAFVILFSGGLSGYVAAADSGRCCYIAAMTAER
jgi:hypothetical protein